MNCAKCGTERIDSAQYCHKCGTAFESTDGEQSLSTTPVFELCYLNPYIVKNTGAFQRLFNPYANDSWRWFAETDGVNGANTIAESSVFHERFMSGVVPTNEECQAARAKIVAKLLSEGWVPMDTNYKDQCFRRRARVTAAT
jgi:hypothetical protein